MSTRHARALARLPFFTEGIRFPLRNSFACYGICKSCYAYMVVFFPIRLQCSQGVPGILRALTAGAVNESVGEGSLLGQIRA